MPNYDYSYGRGPMSTPNDGLFESPNANTNAPEGFREAVYQANQNPYRAVGQNGGFNPQRQDDNFSGLFDPRMQPQPMQPQPRRKKKGLFGRKEKPMPMPPQRHGPNPNRMPNQNPQQQGYRMAQPPRGQQEPPMSQGNWNPNAHTPNMQPQPLSNGAYERPRQAGYGSSVANPNVGTMGREKVASPYTAEGYETNNQRPTEKRQEQEIFSEEMPRLRCSKETEAFLVFELLKGLNRSGEGLATVRPMMARAQLAEMEKLGYDLNRLVHLLVPTSSSSSSNTRTKPNNTNTNS